MPFVVSTCRVLTYAMPSYRMRLVSISCDPNFQFSIDGHDMTVIEADGITHQPVVVNSLQIFAGEYATQLYYYIIL